MTRSVRFFIAASATLILAQGASAQTVPGSVDPGQVQKRFEQPVATPSSTVETRPLPVVRLSVEEQKNLSATRFTLRNVVVKGSTVFSAGQLQSAYNDMVGKNISLLDAQVIGSRITALYRDNRYALSSARVLSGVSNGTLTIQVTEGYVGNVIVKGAAEGTSTYKTIAAYGEQIKKQRPINLSDLERYLLLMSDIPGATANGTLQPTKQAGVADLYITYSYTPYSASYTIDNRGSKYIGPIQHTAVFTANSLIGNSDRTQLRAITTSSTTELRFADLQHDEALGNSGLRVGFTASQSVTHPGDSLKATDIVGDSRFLQARATYPIIRSRRENWNARGLFDVRNTDIDTSGSVPFTRDRLSVARVGSSYDFADRYHGVNLIDLQVSQGLNILGASDRGTNRSRTNGSSDFTKLNVGLSHTHPLPSNFSLVATGSGQYSPDKLLVSEQFTLGGVNFGSAYDSSELSGDYGIAGKLELRHGTYVGNSMLNAYQLYGFYDAGHTWLNGTTSGLTDDKSLSSAGAGVRANFTPWLWGYLEAAVPLSRDAGNQGSHGEDPRLFFSLTGKF